MTSTEFLKDNPDIRWIACLNDKRIIQQHLNDCREERRPYVFYTHTMADKPLRRIVVPVSMLEEEVYKAEICTYMARKTGAHIVLLQAHDYGSHAATNLHKIVTHIQTVAARTGKDISYEVQKAKKDSFHLMQEASERQHDFQQDLIILTASREYGLDDWLFGPPERKAIQRALVPVMLINPRSDLFSLCD